MRLLLDEHYAAVIAQSLRDHGHDVIALQNPELRHPRGGTDEEIFAVAQQTERVLVTENVAHFRAIADRSYRGGGTHAGLLYTTNSAFPRHRHEAFVTAVVAALDGWLHRQGDHPVLEAFLDPRPDA